MTLRVTILALLIILLVPMGSLSPITNLKTEGFGLPRTNPIGVNLDNLPYRFSKIFFPGEYPPKPVINGESTSQECLPSLKPSSQEDNGGILSLIAHDRIMHYNPAMVFMRNRIKKAVQTCIIISVKRAALLKEDVPCQDIKDVLNSRHKLNFKNSFEKNSKVLTNIVTEEDAEIVTTQTNRKKRSAEESSEENEDKYEEFLAEVSSEETLLEQSSEMKKKESISKEVKIEEEDNEKDQDEEKEQEGDEQEESTKLEEDAPETDTETTTYEPEFTTEISFLESNNTESLLQEYQLESDYQSTVTVDSSSTLSTEPLILGIDDDGPKKANLEANENELLELEPQPEIDISMTDLDGVNELNFIAEIMAGVIGTHTKKPDALLLSLMGNQALVSVSAQEAPLGGATPQVVHAFQLDGSSIQQFMMNLIAQKLGEYMQSCIVRELQLVDVSGKFQPHLLKSFLTQSFENPDDENLIAISNIIDECDALTKTIRETVRPQVFATECFEPKISEMCKAKNKSIQDPQTVVSHSIEVTIHEQLVVDDTGSKKTNAIQIEDKTIFTNTSSTALPSTVVTLNIDKEVIHILPVNTTIQISNSSMIDESDLLTTTNVVDPVVITQTNSTLAEETGIPLNIEDVTVPTGNPVVDELVLNPTEVLEEATIISTVTIESTIENQPSIAVTQAEDTNLQSSSVAQIQSSDLPNMNQVVDTPTALIFEDGS